MSLYLTTIKTLDFNYSVRLSHCAGNLHANISHFKYYKCDEVHVFLAD
ncbi:hypothetical protein AXX16_3357 [Serratia rubidaea]|nr:hypothetical protein AXX16_3357 [Serratia rubidaea]